MTALRLASVVSTAVLLSACGASASAPHRLAGTVLLVPGSGFRGAGEVDGEKLSIPASTWRRWGWRPHVVAYRAGAPGLRDVEAALQHAARTGGRVCLYGESSGGTWALDAAARDPGAVDCVIAAAAPTDQETWARSRSSPARSFARTVWPGYFGPSARDDAFEPYDRWRAARPAVRALGLYAAGDPLVPPQQGRIFATAGPETSLRVLAKGHHGFVHSRVSERSFARALEHVRRFASRAARGARR